MQNIHNPPHTQGLVNLVNLEAKIKSAANIRELGFIAANEIFHIFPFRQAFFCLVKRGKIRLHTVSGLAKIEVNTPFVLWFEKLCSHLFSHSKSKPKIFSSSDVPKQFSTGWEEWFPEYLIYLPLKDVDGQINGAVIFACENKPDENASSLLNYVASSIGYAVWALGGRKPILMRTIEGMFASRLTILFIVSIISLLLFMPVQQSVLAPAEIIPLDYTIVTTPMDGVIKKIHVKPNEFVSNGSLLFSLDDTTLKSKLEIAAKVLGVVKSESFLVEQKAFTDLQSKGEMTTQRAKVSEKISEIEYLRKLMNKIDIKAERDGIVIFSDPTDWEGKPVITGEKIMQLADSRSAGVLVWLPVSDAIAIEKNARIRLFLNISPLEPMEAKLKRTSYQTVLSPKSISSYKVIGEFTDPLKKEVRIGLKGTAKIYGDRVALGYYIFRRPIAAFREWSGL